jgi:soluble lytic murein transglycosylase-like protein
MRLHLVLIVPSVLATSLSLRSRSVEAETVPRETVGTITSSTDGSGRKVYVNDEAAPAATRRRSSTPSGSGLAYWSAAEHRWKAVPSANVRAARSAALEVNHYLGSNAGQIGSASAPSRPSPADIDAAINEAAARHHVDPNLVRAVIKVESNFNPNAVSRKGAMGLMQLMPQTARQLNVTNPFDPIQNVDAGVRHLKQLMESYGGDVRLSLAAYNAGAGAVSRSSGIPRFAETRQYVRRITELYNGGPDSRILGGPVHDPVRVERDSRGVLYISNTD